MASRPNRSLAHLLAPLALVIVTIAVFAVLASGTGGEDDEDPKSRSTAETAERETTGPADRAGRRRNRGVYTVKTGDTLGAIAEKTGTDVEQLQLINPELDPQSLIAGQKIKLRE